MSKTSIEWTEHTWNPIVGCSIVSPGCTNCYAMGMAYRFKDSYLGRKVAGPAAANVAKSVNGKSVWTGQLALAPDHIIEAPLKRKKPTVYFVNSMGDLFHEDTPVEWIDRVFAVMALTPQHTYQVLTKRAGRMREYASLLDNEPVRDTVRRIVAAWPGNTPVPPSGITFPLPNVWLGVSTERQQEANERIPLLLQTPAAIRFISAEPLLGPINLRSFPSWSSLHAGLGYSVDALTGTWKDGTRRLISTAPKLDWVIVGGESGTGARPMDPEWALSLRDQCQAAGVPFFFKQWGSHVPETRGRYRRVPKSVAGRLFDGIEHNGFPKTASAAVSA